MKGRRTVFVLGAGASCPCGYPSGIRLRELICRTSGFTAHYISYYNERVRNNLSVRPMEDLHRFRDTFAKSHIKSIDLFMSKNLKLAPIGKYIIAFEILRLEKESCFAEEAKWRQEQRGQLSRERLIARAQVEGTADFIGGDWYSYVYNQFVERLVGRDVLPDFSGGEVVFITFNYDRSLEQFLYESLRNSFTEIPEDRVIGSLKQLRILHAYGQMLPLKWQDANAGVDYKPQQIDEGLLQQAAANIKTIYEQETNPELDQAREYLARAEQIFFLGFGYAPENMKVLRLPTAIPPQCQVYGTAYGLIEEERSRACASVHDHRRVPQKRTVIESRDVDCLTLLRKYF